MEAGTRRITERTVKLCYAVERRYWRGQHRLPETHDFYDPRDIVATPQSFFDRLDAEFDFTLDVCALPENAKCSRFFTPESNGLAQRWDGVCWMNPPFFRGRVSLWLAKAVNEVRENGCTVVAFVHSAFDTKCWHDYALRSAEIRFMRGHLAGCGRAAVVVFRPGESTPVTSTISARG